MMQQDFLNNVKEQVSRSSRNHYLSFLDLQCDEPLSPPKKNPAMDYLVRNRLR